MTIKTHKNKILVVTILLSFGIAVNPCIEAYFNKNNFENSYKNNNSNMVINLSFEDPKIIEKNIYNNTFSSILLKNTLFMREFGKPLLPVKSLNILLPTQSTINKIFIEKELKKIMVKYPVEPSGKIILDQTELNKDIFINNSIYNSSMHYPGKIYEIVSIGKFRGYIILTINIYPVQYNPKQGLLHYCSNISLYIETKQNQKENNLCRDIQNDYRLVKEKVINPSMADNYYQYTKKVTNKEPSSFFRYIIITSIKLANDFYDLIDHKSQYITSNLYLLENIVNDSDFWVNGTWGDNNPDNPYYETTIPYNQCEIFNDTQAKIRNFIRFCHLNLGTDFVLLGGDIDIIPHRDFFGGPVPHYQYPVDQYAYIPADIYYGTLDGNWDRNLNGNFGEQGTDADFFAEVFIGRAPVSNSDGAYNLIKKIKNFETSQKPDIITLHNSYINRENYPRSIEIPISCEKWIPSNYIINRLYQDYQTITFQDWFKAFEQDSLIIQHCGNGYIDYQKYCINKNNIGADTWWNIFLTQELTNNFYPIHISLACWAGGFNRECIAETFLTSTIGGASACIFNSERGVVTSYDAHAYSGEYIERQFFEIFENKTVSLGEVNQYAKEYFCGLAQNDPGYRWCYYTINLLGDPETPVLDKRIKYYNQTFVSKKYNINTPGWNKTHFNNIQNAINVTEISGTVNVSKGNYYENIQIDKPINLICKDNEKAIIDGSAAGNVITVTNPIFMLEGFIITNSGIENAGIIINSSYIKNSSLFYMKNNDISNCGDGISIKNLNAGRADIQNCIIENNKACGVKIENSRNIYMLFCNVSNNEADGILIKDTHQSRIKRCNILDNYIGVKIEQKWNADDTKLYDFGELNRIHQNNFLENTISATFENSLCHSWDNNYWEKPMFLPKLIYGKIKIIGIIIPWIKIAWYTENIPNDI